MFGPPKPLSERLHQKLVREVSGDTFAGTAVSIGDVEPEMEVVAPAPDLLTRLSNLPLESSEQKQQRDEIRGILYAATQEAQEFLDKVIASRNKVLKAQLEEIRRRGREQQTIIDALEADRQQKEFQFHSARNHAQNCRDMLDDLQNTRFSRWDSEETREQLRKKIAAAKEAIREANEQYAHAQAAHNEAADDLSKAQGRMGEISDCEIKLRGELSGKPYRDPTTALLVLPTV